MHIMLWAWTANRDWLRSEMSSILVSKQSLRHWMFWSVPINHSGCISSNCADLVLSVDILYNESFSCKLLIHLEHQNNLENNVLLLTSVWIRYHSFRVSFENQYLNHFKHSLILGNKSQHASRNLIVSRTSFSQAFLSALHHLTHAASDPNIFSGKSWKQKWKIWSFLTVCCSL